MTSSCPGDPSGVLAKQSAAWDLNQEEIKLGVLHPYLTAI